MSDGGQGGNPGDRLASPVEGPTESSDPCVDRFGCTSQRYEWLCEDDPPPYTSLVGTDSQHRVAWSYMFPGLPYEDSGGPSNDPRTIARPLVSIPLTSYGIFKIEPPRYAVAINSLPRPYPRMMSEPGPAIKQSTSTARKYGVILIAATVIIFLMVLSLMVRFVTEKSLWKN